MQEKLASADAAAARIAGRQHGVISTSQLMACGLSDEGIRRRVGAERLHRIHRGVYAVGHRGFGIEARWMAAVLACGPNAALSHRAAAALWRLLALASEPVDVTVPGTGGRPRRNGIRAHRSRTLIDAQVTRRKGIPVTTPARTLFDLKRTCRPDQVRRAIRQAEVLGLRLGTEFSPDGTRSELEHRFLALCRRHRLPTPEVNVLLAGFTVDFLWRERSLVAETDGYRYHRGAQAFEEDRSRDLELRMLGYEILRFTYSQVTGEPERVARLLRALLEPNP